MKYDQKINMGNCLAQLHSYDMNKYANCPFCIDDAAPDKHQIESLKQTNITSTLAERGSKYGSFISHADITQQLKSVMHDTPNWSKLQADQKECLEMVAHKIGRILNGDPNYHDSWHDIEGYVKLVADRLLDIIK